MATQNASDLKIQELEAQLGLLQAQTERASSLDYALIQVQERAQAADAHISYLQGVWWHTLHSTATRAEQFLCQIGVCCRPARFCSEARGPREGGSSAGSGRAGQAAHRVLAAQGGERLPADQASGVHSLEQPCCYCLETCPGGCRHCSLHQSCCPQSRPPRFLSAACSICMADTRWHARHRCFRWSNNADRCLPGGQNRQQKPGLGMLRSSCSVELQGRCQTSHRCAASERTAIAHALCLSDIRLPRGEASRTRLRSDAIVLPHA